MDKGKFKRAREFWRFCFVYRSREMGVGWVVVANKCQQGKPKVK